ncbi:MAG: RnfABCDGE type electron transport complex subunit B [Lentisphaerae bacterium]|nr:RnfABCDGE type electron transport complex subunit B [Lentisphaerota bacterium]
MDLNLIFTTTAVISVIGLVCGILLAFIAKKFGEKEDPRVALVEDVLPGANCGGCGYAGCAAYARAIVLDDAPLNLCIPSGPKTLEALSRVTGRAGGEMVEPLMAVILCSGDRNAAQRQSDYNGISDCSAANVVAGGWKACAYGCLGFGTCARMCAFGAISIRDGLAVVDPELCTGCGACAKVCPRMLIKIVPRKHKINIMCSSLERGAVVRKICEKGCIGCTMCVRLENNPETLSMNGALARIDYSKEPIKNEGVIEKCPVKCIVKIG